MTFERETPDGTAQTSARFHVQPEILTDSTDADLGNMQSNFMDAIENFNQLGSSWIPQSITSFTISCAPYRPAIGSSYLPTPSDLRNKRAVLNVQNKDNLCFLYAVAAGLKNVDYKKQAYRTYHYRDVIAKFNVKGLKFPLALRDVNKFELLNPTVSVNVFEYGTGDILPRYVTKERERENHVNLLILTNEDETQWHYATIRSLSALLAGRTKRHNAAHVCPYCLHSFMKIEHLNAHVTMCSTHPPQAVSYPVAGKDDELKFRATQRQHHVPAVIYVDFECFLIPENNENGGNSKTVNTHVHKPSGFCCLTVTQWDIEPAEPYVYSSQDSDDVMNAFYDYLELKQREICNKLGHPVPMKPLTLSQQQGHDAAICCKHCGENFSAKNHKVRHHDHLTGEFIETICNRCNIQLKFRKRKVNGNGRGKGKKGRYAMVNDQDTFDDDFEVEDTNGKKEWEYFIPIFAHNMKNYDSHLILKAFTRNRSENITVIPTSTEKFIAFEIGYLRFLDSFQFLTSSLDNLVQSLVKNGRDKFIYTNKAFGGSDLVFEKGVFCYEYMSDPKRFEDKELPSRDKFYSALKGKDISEKKCAKAQKAWTEFNCNTLQDYHDAYLKLDTVLLADVFENFRKLGIESYGLDPAHYYTLPGFSWDACLRMTDVKLELLTDPEKYLFFENSIRGGVSCITHRYALANNPYMQDEDRNRPTEIAQGVINNETENETRDMHASDENPDSNSYIIYLDCNNLYGHAMSQLLPTGGFRFLTRNEIVNFDLSQITADSEKGYVLEVDLAYPEEKHDEHNDYPLAPEKMKVTIDMLSPYARGLQEGHTLTEKLIPNLCAKTGYVVHYRNLQLYIKLGMKVTTIHRILEFKQERWMAPYIEFNSLRRKSCQSDFEKDFYKLLNNAVFGKTMENIRNRVNVQLVIDNHKFIKRVSKQTFERFEIISDDLVVVRMKRIRLVQNKPIYVGFCILELSKQHMFNFHYNVVKKIYKK